MKSTAPDPDLRGAAELFWGEAGAFIYDAYRQWRRRIDLFDVLPEQLPMVIGLAPYGRCLGLTRRGEIPRISIASTLFAEGRNVVADVVLHEMIHAYLNITRQDPAHKARPWKLTCSALSPTVLGFDLDLTRPQRKSVRVDGKVRKEVVPGAISMAEIAGWPRTFRGTDFDPGRPISCPTY